MFVSSLSLDTIKFAPHSDIGLKERNKIRSWSPDLEGYKFFLLERSRDFSGYIVWMSKMMKMSKGEVKVL